MHIKNSYFFGRKISISIYVSLAWNFQGFEQWNDKSHVYENSLIHVTLGKAISKNSTKAVLLLLFTFKLSFGCVSQSTHTTQMGFISLYMFLWCMCVGFLFHGISISSSSQSSFWGNGNKCCHTRSHRTHTRWTQTRQLTGVICPWVDLLAHFILTTVNPRLIGCRRCWP